MKYRDYSPRGHTRRLRAAWWFNRVRDVAAVSPPGNVTQPIVEGDKTEPAAGERAQARNDRPDRRVASASGE